MRRPLQLPSITFRGRKYFVDVRLAEIREIDFLTPLSFDEYWQIATPEETITLECAICEYLSRRSAEV